VRCRLPHPRNVVFSSTLGWKMKITVDYKGDL
jgi:hypothetical protein